MSQQSDRETFRALLRRKPVRERYLLVEVELFKYIKAREMHSGEFEKVLPDYCYNIFAVYGRTYFKGFPSFEEIISITDKERMTSVRGIEKTKQGLKIDWRRLGRLIGIRTRGMRFFDLEAEEAAKTAGLLDLTPEDEKGLKQMLFGKQPMGFGKEFLKSQTIAQKKSGNLKMTGTHTPAVWSELAYQWGPEALAEFNAGMGEGNLCVLDENGQMAGESSRANIYNFLLLAWPEIKEMLEAKPRKTVSNLYEWMLPFMRLNVVATVDLDYLRDVCAPPSQSGIGLKLRPLSSRSSKPSA